MNSQPLNGIKWWYNSNSPKLLKKPIHSCLLDCYWADLPEIHACTTVFCKLPPCRISRTCGKRFSRLHYVKARRMDGRDLYIRLFWLCRERLQRILHVFLLRISIPEFTHHIFNCSLVSGVTKNAKYTDAPQLKTPWTTTHTHDHDTSRITKC